MAPENESLKTLDFFWFHLFRYKGSHMQKMGQNKAFLLFLGHPSGPLPPQQGGGALHVQAVLGGQDSATMAVR